MEKEGMSVYAAIPSVVFGKDHTINHILKSPSIVIPFETDAGVFVVDVCIKKAMDGPKLSRNYRVINEKTPVESREKIPTDKENITNAVPAPVEMDRKTILMNKLREINKMRDDIVRQLSEKPFMPITQRQLLKKRIPVLDTQIKRLRLDLSTLEMLSNLSKDDLENPKIIPHFQHYDRNIKKP